jgi:hypothetical protein
LKNWKILDNDTYTNEYPLIQILDNEFSSFCHYYRNSGDRLHDQHYLSESYSASHTNPNSVQGQGANLHTILEIEAEVYPKPPFVKRILLVDDDPELTLTFKAGLEGHYYDPILC